MTKPKSPLLSLEAKGTIADTLTFQKTGAGLIARTKPIPTDRRTLLQQYQRWDYQHYTTLWQALTAAEKQTWANNSRRLRISGYNYWMRTYLSTLPDLVGRWRFDRLSGAVTPDTSKNSNHGTIYGARHVDGYIAAALDFDGLDDVVDCGKSDSLDFTTSFTALIRIKRHRLVNYEGLICRRYSTYGPDWAFVIMDNNLMYKGRHPGVVVHSGNTDSRLTALNTWLMLALSWTGTFIDFWIDADRTTHIAQAGVLAVHNNTYIGKDYNTGYKTFDGIIDDVHLYVPHLSDTQIQQWSERSYP